MWRYSIFCIKEWSVADGIKVLMCVCVCFRVRSGMVQYAAVLQKLFSQMLCAWTAVPEANIGQQRAYRYAQPQRSS